MRFPGLILAGLACLLLPVAAPAVDRLPVDIEFAIADYVVLSEVYYDSPGTDIDCFVELYNPTDTAVSLAGWALVGLNGNGNSEYGTINLSGSIASHGYFLVGQDGSVLGVAADLVNGNANYQNGADGLKLKGPGGVLVDYIGYGDDPDINLEGMAWVDVPPGSSIERKSGPIHDEDAGNGWDTQSNIDDLRTRTSPQPQNASSPIEDPPSGVDTTPPTFAGLDAVVDAGLGGSLLLEWVPATDPEGSTPITYRVYRSLTTGGQNFGAPHDSTVATDGYADNGLVNGQTYHYVVRAVDSFGNEETNTVEHSGAPSGTPPVFNAYFGTLHSHTSLSDGMGTPTTAFTHARDVAGIDVLAISEHTHQVTTAEYASLRTDADTFNQDGVFVAIAAQEVGVLSEFGHLNVYDGPTVVPVPSSDLAGTYQYIEDNQAAASFCHPADWNGTNFNNFAYDAAADATLGGLAILSGGGPDYEGPFEFALGRGWRVGVIGDQDVHSMNWGDETNPSGDILLTGFPIDALTRGNVLDAIKTRRTYAFEANPASDRIAFEFSALGQPMGAEVMVGFSVDFLVRVVAPTDLAIMELRRDGVVIDTWDDGTRAAVWAPTDAPSLGIHIYTIYIEQEDGDRLWSSPLWVEATGQVAVEELTSPTPTRLRIAASPNPFRFGTRLVVDMPSDAHLGVRVLTVDGRVARVLYDAPAAAGLRSFEWDGTLAGGAHAASGVYFIEAQAGEQRSVQKLLLTR